MIRIEPLTAGKFALRSQYSPRIVSACRSIPGMTWDKDERAWIGYKDAMSEAIEGIRGALSDVEFDTVEVSRVKGGIGILPVNNLPDPDLRLYQRFGVDFLVRHSDEGVILADVMGAGKTVQAIRAARALGQKTVVVCPSFVRGVWEAELRKWWPGAEVEAREGIKRVPVPREVDVQICHYDILFAHVDALLAWAGQGLTLVLDEAHYLASEKSRRSKAVRKLAAAASRRISLTGTPMTNRPKDLWNVVDTISPGRFDSFFSYARRYCDAVQQDIRMGQDIKTVWNFDGASNLDELRRRLSFFMLRRTHEDIKLELPPLTRQVVEVRVPTTARVLPTRLGSAHDMRRSLDLAADAKLDDVEALVSQHLEDGNRCVVFCYRRAVAEHIAAAVGGICIHGGHSREEREERIRRIANGGEGWKPCLVATIDVASVGIDLTFANVCVFAELTWEPVELAQAEARVFRFGQTSPVVVQYVIALGTGDELIRDGVIGKIDKINEAVGEVAPGLRGALRGGPDAERAALEQLWNSL